VFVQVLIPEAMGAETLIIVRVSWNLELANKWKLLRKSAENKAGHSNWRVTNIEYPINISVCVTDWKERKINLLKNLPVQQ
jgi:hypothetical protein